MACVLSWAKEMLENSKLNYVNIFEIKYRQVYFINDRIRNPWDVYILSQEYYFDFTLIQLHLIDESC